MFTGSISLRSSSPVEFASALIHFHQYLPESVPSTLLITLQTVDVEAPILTYCFQSPFFTSAHLTRLYMMFIHHKDRRNTTKDRTDRVQNYMNYKLHSNLNFE